MCTPHTYSRSSFNSTRATFSPADSFGNRRSIHSSNMRSVIVTAAVPPFRLSNIIIIINRYNFHYWTSQWYIIITIRIGNIIQLLCCKWKSRGPLTLAVDLITCVYMHMLQLIIIVFDSALAATIRAHVSQDVSRRRRSLSTMSPCLSRETCSLVGINRKRHISPSLAGSKMSRVSMHYFKNEKKIDRVVCFDFLSIIFTGQRTFRNGLRWSCDQCGSAIRFPTAFGNTFRRDDDFGNSLKLSSGTSTLTP